MATEAGKAACEVRAVFGRRSHEKAERPPSAQGEKAGDALEVLGWAGSWLADADLTDALGT